MTDTDSGPNIQGSFYDHTIHLCDAHGLTIRSTNKFCGMQMGLELGGNQEQFADAVEKL